MNPALQSLAEHLVIFALVLALTTASADSGTDASSEHTASYKEVTDGSGNDTHHHDADHGHGGVHVVHIQFDYVDRPLILSLFLIAVVLIKIG